jgi:hypothetical protein
MTHYQQATASSNACQRCGNPTLKPWNALDDEQKLLVDKLPASADYTLMERKKHRFCTRCWFEEVVSPDVRA